VAEDREPTDESSNNCQNDPNILPVSTQPSDDVDDLSLQPPIEPHAESHESRAEYSTDDLSSELSVSFDELRAATNNFSQTNIIGRGGYGTVYKGLWKETIVAIKRISFRRSVDYMKEIIGQVETEMKALSVYRHDNILSLYAFCLENTEACLVYQFMHGGSLNDRLFGTSYKPLTWDQRLHIMIGSCRGLNYLHTFKTEPLVHGDVKGANILLDRYLEPKIGDFGLCRRINLQKPDTWLSSVSVGHIKGTMSYLPPEYIAKKLISTKLDVYSFGVVSKNSLCQKNSRRCRHWK
ncbi:unnamed protein product, partial [Soboliphyme baturini]|uniref:Protein kinase domain-containing protein n=1 Tax=Soboliphyme baturini TaxID=241478 RepID=A0A183IR28_9BILA